MDLRKYDADANGNLVAQEVVRGILDEAQMALEQRGDASSISGVVSGQRPMKKYPPMSIRPHRRAVAREAVLPG